MSRAPLELKDASRRAPRGMSWQQALATVQERPDADVPPADSNDEVLRGPLWYVIDDTVEDAACLKLGLHELGNRRRGADTTLEPVSVNRGALETLVDEHDRTLVAWLLDASGAAGIAVGEELSLGPMLRDHLLPGLARTGRLRLMSSPEPLAYDDGPAFSLRVDVRESQGMFTLRGELVRSLAQAPSDGGDDRIALASLLWATGDGLAATRTKLVRFDPAHANWVRALLLRAALEVPKSARATLLEAIHLAPRPPAIDVPASLALTRVTPTLSPVLHVDGAGDARTRDWLRADVRFSYDGTTFGMAGDEACAIDDRGERVVVRDAKAERAATTRLYEVGFSRAPRIAEDGLSHRLQVSRKRLSRAVSTLVSEGWHVEVDGRLHRRPSSFSLSVRTSIDWFDLASELSFEGGAHANAEALFGALKHRRDHVELDDGSIGVLPTEWLASMSQLADAIELHDGELRVKRSRLALLDVLLADLPFDVSVDEQLATLRQELAVPPRAEDGQAPAGFSGELRPYQAEGLAWFAFLRRVHAGGCLADDMGLGKTIQVLALLEQRRMEQPRRPSLVVAPRSLVFNWKLEAARFTPELRVIDGSGKEPPDAAALANADLVLVTYGTLRRDVLTLRDVPFDYVVLDEAHAIKNPRSESAKAARLLRAEHRLALTGTPIENHLGELGSLFDFLNPQLFRDRTGAAGRAVLDVERARVVGRALRPFVLRRTKEQVAPELPPKQEQLVYAELSETERALYDATLESYRASLQDRIARFGLVRARMHVLEALLRLRQISCHPGLVDPSRKAEPSAKLELLLEQLVEVTARGHKALVFSQFTSLLDLVRDRLAERDVVFERLDGKTRDREKRVERFQTDPDCRVFLISLKAGGVGLNLTAADYVFVLDPWWNASAEAQAIDRAHRIGQDKHVFVYKLIAKNTIEQKVLLLQDKKREVALAALSNAEPRENMLEGLSLEDMQWLLT